MGDFVHYQKGMSKTVYTRVGRKGKFCIPSERLYLDSPRYRPSRDLSRVKGHPDGLEVISCVAPANKDSTKLLLDTIVDLEDQCFLGWAFVAMIVSRNVCSGITTARQGGGGCAARCHGYREPRERAWKLDIHLGPAHLYSSSMDLSVCIVRQYRGGAGGFEFENVYRAFGSSRVAFFGLSQLRTMRGQNWNRQEGQSGQRGKYCGRARERAVGNRVFDIIIQQYAIMEWLEESANRWDPSTGLRTVGLTSSRMPSTMLGASRQAGDWCCFDAA